MTNLYGGTFRSLVLFALAAALVACGGQRQSVPPATVFNQKLTDLARPVSTLPPGVEKIECWADKRVVRSDRVFCNVSLTGRASEDMGEKAVGWAIPVRGRGGSRSLGELGGDDDHYLHAFEFDFPLLAVTGFVFVAKNAPQGLTIEVAANQDRVSFSQAEKFIVAVLPVVSKDLTKHLQNLQAAAPATVRATWANQ